MRKHPIYGPETLELLNHFRRPRMSAHIRFALVYSPRRGDGKVVAFNTIDQLCKAIHGGRGNAPIQLQGGELLFQGETEKRKLVSIYTLDDAGGRHRFLGHAWLDGRGVEALQVALRTASPELMQLGMAA